MRQREITWQGWRVSWPDVDGGRHTFTADYRDEAEREAAALWRDGADDVRVVCVTRYRLAPLVEIAAWRVDDEGATAGTIKPGGPWATVERTGSLVAKWSASACAGDARMSSHGHSTKAAAMAAAEAHLAVLGYRVAKEKRR